MTSKKRRRRPVAKAPVPGVLQLDRQENIDHFAERVPIFEVDGKTYTIPKYVPVSWTAKATQLAMTEGEGVAQAYAMVVMLGDEGIEALNGCETLTQEDAALVQRIIANKVFPGTGDVTPKDSSPASSGDGGSNTP